MHTRVGHVCPGCASFALPPVRNITGGPHSCGSALGGVMVAGGDMAGERGSDVGSFMSSTELPNVTAGPPQPPTPTLLSHPHLLRPLPLPPISSSDIPSPPQPPRGGSADSYILGRSRGFLTMSKSPAGLWPPPDGQRRSEPLPQRPACTQTCDRQAGRTV